MTGSSATVLSRRGLLTGSAALLAGAAAARTADTVLRIGDQRGGCQAVMKAAGALAGVPYTIEWKQFPAAAPLLEALNADAVDIAAASDSPTTFALAAGVKGRVIGATRGSAAGTSIIVPANSPIQTVADLRGRKIGTNRGSVGHALVLAVAESQLWGPDDIRIANLMPADAKAALASGAIEAWSTWNIYVAQARLNDGARVVASGAGLLSGLSFQTTTVSAIEARPAELKDYLRRLNIAWRWAAANPDAYAAALAAEIGVAVPVAKLAFQTDVPVPVAIDDGVVAAEQRTADRYLGAKLLRERLDATTVFDRSFNSAVG
jgi:sulfonate transport system substrate-binding protein